MNTKKQNCLVDRFSFLEKLIIRGGFLAVILVSILEIDRQSPTWGALYAALLLFAFIFPIFYGICSHCPYPYRYKDCLFVPHQVITLLYKYRGPKFTTADKIMGPGALLSVLVVPQFFIYERPIVAVLFWLFMIPGVLSIPVYLCRRCRNVGCPLNKVPQAGRKEELRLCREFQVSRRDSA